MYSEHAHLSLSHPARASIQTGGFSSSSEPFLVPGAPLLISPTKPEAASLLTISISIYIWQSYWGSFLYWLTRAAIANCHRLEFKRQKSIFPIVLEATETQDQGVSRVGLSQPSLLDLQMAPSHWVLTGSFLCTHRSWCFLCVRTVSQRTIARLRGAYPNGLILTQWLFKVLSLICSPILRCWRLGFSHDSGRHNSAPMLCAGHHISVWSVKMARQGRLCFVGHSPAEADLRTTLNPQTDALSRRQRRLLTLFEEWRKGSFTGWKPFEPPWKEEVFTRQGGHSLQIRTVGLKL